MIQPKSSASGTSAKEHPLKAVIALAIVLQASACRFGNTMPRPDGLAANANSAQSARARSPIVDVKAQTAALKDAAEIPSGYKAILEQTTSVHTAPAKSSRSKAVRPTQSSPFGKATLPIPENHLEDLSRAFGGSTAKNPQAARARMNSEQKRVNPAKTEPAAEKVSAPKAKAETTAAAKKSAPMPEQKMSGDTPKKSEKPSGVDPEMAAAASFLANRAAVKPQAAPEAAANPLREAVLKAETAKADAIAKADAAKLEAAKNMAAAQAAAKKEAAKALKAAKTTPKTQPSMPPQVSTSSSAPSTNGPSTTAMTQPTLPLPEMLSPAEKLMAKLSVSHKTLVYEGIAVLALLAVFFIALWLRIERRYGSKKG